MSNVLTWSLGLIGLIGLTALTVGCVALHGPGIEADIDARASAAVARFPMSSVHVDGRDVTLVGAAATDGERAAALAAAASVRGVRIVRDGLTVTSAAGATTLDSAGVAVGAFSLSEGDDGVVVRGRVPDETARAAVLARVGAVFPGRSVTDGMAIDPSVPDWQGALGAVMPELGGVAMPGVTSNGTTVVLRGRVASAEAKARIEAAINAALPAGFTLLSELDVGGAMVGTTRTADQLDASGDATVAGAEAALAEVLAQGHITFDSGTARLTASSRAILDRAAAVFARFPAIAAEIKGFTDDEGGRRTNRILSIRRAEATRDYLVSKGVDAARLTPRGNGSADPVADNGTEAGRARNRRVVFALRSL